MEPLYFGIIGLARTLFRTQGLDLTIHNIGGYPKDTGAVIVVNHTGYFDFVYAGIPAREHKRYVRYMAKAEVFDHRIAGPIMRELRHIPVDRASGAASYQAAVDDLRRGEYVGVFPEATISRSFEIKKFKSGAVRMALEAGVPIIPVTIWGSQRVWSKGLPKHLLRPAVPIIIDVGEPMTAYEPVDACTEELRTRMQRTLERLQDEYARRYGPYPAGANWVPRRLGGSAPTLEEATALDDADQAERMRRRAERTGGSSDAGAAGSAPGSDSSAGPAAG